MEIHGTDKNGESVKVGLLRPESSGGIFGHTEFFVGAFCANKSVAFDLSDYLDVSGVRTVRSDGCFMVGSALDMGGQSRSLVHENAGNQSLLCFRGYLLEPAVHGWHDESKIQTDLSRSLPSSPNGVFAAVRYSEKTNELELTTDAIGLSPLYVRDFGQCLFFASHPSFLRMAGDRFDIVAIQSMISCGSMFGSHSLLSSVKRVAPGTQLTYSASGVTERVWYQPKVVQPFMPASPNVLEKVEQSFQTAMARCLSLDTQAKVSLPLSSGYDSRRILASVYDRGRDFQAMTVEVQQVGNRNLDARYASELADKFGFPHKVIGLPDDDKYGVLDSLRRRLVEAESGMHTWSLRMREEFSENTTLIFDGAAGDVLGETGFEDRVLFTASNSGQLSALVDILIGKKLFGGLLVSGPGAFEAIRADAKAWLETLPSPVRADTAYLLSRTARAIGLWSQRLVPAGHVPVYPFLDLDYLNVTLSVDPLSKLSKSMQASCLERYWPEFFEVPGSRAIPATLHPGKGERNRRRELESAYTLFQELKNCQSDLGHLTRAARTAVALGRISPPAVARWLWWLRPVLEAEVWRASTAPGLSVTYGRGK